MVKKEQSDKTNQYLLAIVGIVAVVGIVILLMNADTLNITGQATRAKAVCGDGTCTGGEAKAPTTSSFYCDADCHYSTDTDGDGLYDYQETLGLKGAMTDPNNADSDDDGLTDYEELVTYGSSDPNKADSDYDGLSDYEEVVTYGTNPKANDTDGDTHPDAVEVSLGTDPADSSSYPLPDLAIYESLMSYVVEGDAYVYDGIVIDEDATGTLTAAMVNQGQATASGKTKSKATVYYGTTTVNSAALTSTTFSLGVGSTETWIGSRPLSGTALPLLQGLYGGGAVVDVNYELDHYSNPKTRYGITESDETNNAGTVYLTADGSGLTFTDVECGKNEDCPEGCGCGNSTTTVHVCVEMETRGASTYYTTTECSE